MKAMHQAVKLDPVAVPTSTALGWLYFYSHRFEDARRQAVRTLDLSPYFARAHVLRAQAAAHLGLEAEAKAAVESAVSLGKDEVIAHRHLASVYAILGLRSQALEHLRELQRLGGDRQAAFTGFVCAYLRLDRETFEWLGRAYESRDPTLPLVKTYPSMDPYRADPRYLQLLAKLKMPA
jgi:tetratricopeptide (TPR) repeat protein